MRDDLCGNKAAGDGGGRLLAANSITKNKREYAGKRCMNGMMEMENGTKDGKGNVGREGRKGDGKEAGKEGKG